MSWEPSWQDLTDADELEEKDRRSKTAAGLLDEEGYKILSIRERLARSFAMLIFIVVFPFVFVGLGIYRSISLLGSMISLGKKTN
jgi:hypothetical protein